MARTKSAWPTMLLAVGAGVISAVQVGKAPVAIPAIQSDLGLGLGAASWILSAFAVVGAAVGIAIGLAVGRLEAQRAVVVGLALQAICSAIGGLAPSAALLLATRVVEGIGFLAVIVAAPALIIAATREGERGAALAVWATFMPAGITLAMLAAPLLAAAGWRAFWLLNGALLLGYAILVALSVRPAEWAREQPTTILQDVQRTLLAAGPWLLAALFAAFSTAYFAVFGFLPLILADRLAVAPGVASVMTALAVAASGLGNLACAPLLARGMPPWRIVLMSFGALALCAWGVFASDSPAPVAYGSCVAFSFLSGLIPPALFAEVPRYAPRPALVGATIGFLMQGNNVGLVLGPVAAAATVEAAGWPFVGALVGAIAVAAGALALALRIPRAGKAEAGANMPT